MKKSVVVFDFDGVLTVGGEGLKHRAWHMLQIPWGVCEAKTLVEAQEKFSNGNGSRYDILRRTFDSIFKGMLDKDVYAPALIDAYADCYNTIVQKLLEQSGMPEGTEQALAKLAERHTLFVNSATPEKAVRESVQNFNIHQYFRGIFGQPISKVDNLARAQHIAHIDHEYMLFVGDSDGDAKAARKFGCDFVGVANELNKWTADTVKFPLVSSMVELPALLTG